VNKLGDSSQLSYVTVNSQSIIWNCVCSTATSRL